MPSTTTATPQVERVSTAQRSGGHSGKAALHDKGKERTFMDRWVEPSLAAPKASYEDHGAAPYGVLEHMQPLGELPSTKVKQRVKGDGLRKSVLGRSAAAVGGDVQSTPEGTPAPGSSTSHVEESAPSRSIVIEDERDDDYAPGKHGKKKERSARPRAVKRKSEPSESVPPAPAPPSAGATKRKAAASTRSRVTQYEYDGEKLKKVVEAAKARAMAANKPETADAVNEIYEQSLSDQILRSLLEAILTQNATPRQNVAFQDYVRAAKKKLKDAKNKARQDAAAKPSKTHHGQAATYSPAKALTLQPVHNSSTREPSAAIPSTELLEPTKPKISLKLKSTAKDPNRRRSGNGKMSVSPRKRSGSVGSDSSLTSLTSNEDDTDEEGLASSARPTSSFAGSSSRPNGMQGKDHAAERGSLAAPSTTGKRSSTDAFEDERERALAAKKQRLSEKVEREYHFQESSVRPALSQHRSRLQRIKEGTLAPPSLRLDPHGIRTASTRGSRAPSVELNSPLSDLSPANSRQTTPRLHKPPPRTTGKRAKTKQSPEKRQLAAHSGMSGAGGAGRNSPIGDDDNELKSENNDYCSACGGSGYLLCCDGCDRAFHFTCLDPPLGEEAKELDEPWYCYICVARKPITAESAEKKAPIGLFAPLLVGLKKSNPRNFDLPESVKNYFEGVSADRNGAFVDAVSGKPTRNRPGYSDDQPDYYRLRDSKGALVLCYQCGQSSHQIAGTKRAIVTCDHCHQHWHLDCLDPPLANPPALNQNGKKVHEWMCPLHVDQELRKVDVSLLRRRKAVDTSSFERRRIHVRKPKNAMVAETALNRGHRNNGIIEVLDDESDASDSEFYDHDDGPIVYKLPSHGIKLDFIDKVKDTRVQELRDERAYQRRRMHLAATTPSVLEQANFARRSFVEQQVALNLAQFAGENNDLGLGHNQVENLVGALIAEAPSAVVEEITAAEDVEKSKSSTSVAPPSPPVSEQTAELSHVQREELLKLRELINRRLEGSKT